MLPTNETQLRHYAKGYSDGLVKGVDEPPDDDVMRYWYGAGYEAGVAEYCRNLNEE